MSRRTALLGLIGLLAPIRLSLLSEASADEAARNGVPPGTSSAETSPEDDERERRQNTVAIGVLILVGVAAIGLLLLAAALIWGAKVRRLVRKPNPEPTRQDDLWYLRKAAENEVATTDEQDTPAPSETDDTHS